MQATLQKTCPSFLGGSLITISKYNSKIKGLKSLIVRHKEEMNKEEEK